MIKAIILSAGQGQRLKPLTNNCPKGMVRILGCPIIEWQIGLFRRAGISEIAIVKGFCPESIPDYGARHYINQEYAVTNMVYSLFCAEPELHSGPVIISYGDILYSERVLRALLTSSSPGSVVVDLDWKKYFAQRFKNPYEDAESLVISKKGLITRIGQSQPAPEDVQAQYIGLVQFSDIGLEAIRQLRDKFGTSAERIGWGRPWSQAYMTDMLQELIRSGTDVTPVCIQGGWCEIDSLRDFELAEKVAKRLQL